MLTRPFVHPALLLCPHFINYPPPPPSVTSLFFYFPLSSNSFSSGLISMWLPYLSSHYAPPPPLFFSPVLSPSLFLKNLL